MQIQMLVPLGGESLNLTVGDVVDVEGLADKFGTTLTDEELAWALCTEPAEEPRAAWVGDIPAPPAEKKLTAKELKALEKAKAKAAADLLAALTPEELAALEALTDEERQALAPTPPDA